MGFMGFLLSVDQMSITSALNKHENISATCKVGPSNLQSGPLPVKPPHIRIISPVIMAGQRTPPPPGNKAPY